MPEPGTLLLAGMGILLLAGYRWRKRRARPLLESPVVKQLTTLSPLFNGVLGRRSKWLSRATSFLEAYLFGQFSTSRHVQERGALQTASFGAIVPDGVGPRIHRSFVRLIAPLKPTGLLTRIIHKRRNKSASVRC